jgi:arylsulfatase A-like enzyme
MKILALTVDQACTILDAVGCSDDPVKYRGHETSPGTILSAPSERDPEGNRKASRVEIEYWNGMRRTLGTLQDMVVDRLRPRRSR